MASAIKGEPEAETALGTMALAPTTFPLMSLPAEVRLAIFSWALYVEDSIPVTRWLIYSLRPPLGLHHPDRKVIKYGLLGVANCQVFCEAQEAFLSTNTFSLSGVRNAKYLRDYLSSISLFDTEDKEQKRRDGTASAFNWIRSLTISQISDIRVIDAHMGLAISCPRLTTLTIIMDWGLFWSKDSTPVRVRWHNKISTDDIAKRGNWERIVRDCIECGSVKTLILDFRPINVPDNRIRNIVWVRQWFEVCCEEKLEVLGYWKGRPWGQSVGKC